MCLFICLFARSFVPCLASQHALGELTLMMNGRSRFQLHHPFITITTIQYGLGAIYSIRIHFATSSIIVECWCKQCHDRIEDRFGTLIWKLNLDLFASVYLEFAPNQVHAQCGANNSLWNKLEFRECLVLGPCPVGEVPTHPGSRCICSTIRHRALVTLTIVSLQFFWPMIGTTFLVPCAVCPLTFDLCGCRGACVYVYERPWLARTGGWLICMTYPMPLSFCALPTRVSNNRSKVVNWNRIGFPFPWALQPLLHVAELDNHRHHRWASIVIGAVIRTGQALFDHLAPSRTDPKWVSHGPWSALMSGLVAMWTRMVCEYDKLNSYPSVRWLCQSKHTHWQRPCHACCHCTHPNLVSQWLGQFGRQPPVDTVQSVSEPVNLSPTTKQDIDQLAPKGQWQSTTSQWPNCFI